MTITTYLFEAFLRCPTKCYLLSLGETGTENAYADWIRTRNEPYENEGIKRLIGEHPDGECVCRPPDLENLKKVKWQVAVNLSVQTQDLESIIQAVERVSSDGQGKPAQFIPIRYIFTNKVSRDDKLLLAFDALVLWKILGPLRT